MESCNREGKCEYLAIARKSRAGIFHDDEMRVLDLPSLTILPGIVATIRDEKLRICPQDLYHPQDIPRGFPRGRLDDATEVLSRGFSSLSDRDPLRPRAGETFFLVKYDELVSRGDFADTRAISRSRGQIEVRDDKIHVFRHYYRPGRVAIEDEQRRSSSSPTERRVRLVDEDPFLSRFSLGRVLTDLSPDALPDGFVIRKSVAYLNVTGTQKLGCILDVNTGIFRRK